jgi:YD repeat-containing protein
MLPDFLFDYDSAGRLTQLTQILQNSGTYLTWNYDYNANGLKQSETCYDKDKQVVGKIVYYYN